MPATQIMREKSPAERFVTFFLAEFHLDGGGKYLSAGHTTGYVYRSGSNIIEDLPSNNTIVGAFDFSSFQSTPIGLEARRCVVELLRRIDRRRRR